MAITTSESLKGARGQYCSVCKTKKPLVRVTNAGLVCYDCAPEEDAAVQLATDDVPEYRRPEER